MDRYKSDFIGARSEIMFTIVIPCMHINIDMIQNDQEAFIKYIIWLKSQISPLFLKMQSSFDIYVEVGTLLHNFQTGKYFM